jgi:hypothetical protein
VEIPKKSPQKPTMKTDTEALIEEIKGYTKLTKNWIQNLPEEEKKNQNLYEKIKGVVTTGTYLTKVTFKWASIKKKLEATPLDESTNPDLLHALIENPFIKITRKYKILEAHIASLPQTRNETLKAIINSDAYQRNSYSQSREIQERWAKALQGRMHRIDILDELKPPKPYPVSEIYPQTLKNPDHTIATRPNLPLDLAIALYQKRDRKTQDILKDNIQAQFDPKLLEEVSSDLKKMTGRYKEWSQIPQEEWTRGYQEKVQREKEKIELEKEKEGEGITQGLLMTLKKDGEERGYQYLKNLSPKEEESLKIYLNKNKTPTTEDVLSQLPFLGKETPTPNITLEMRDPSQKFIFGQDEAGQKYVISKPLAYHRDILEDFRRQSGILLQEVSGGFIEKSEDSYAIYGLSESFGAAPLEEVKELLEQEGLQVEINSALDRSIKEEEGKFSYYLTGLPEFVKQVAKKVKEVAILGGFDKMKPPTQISDNLACVLYSTENGGTFGFDTLYVGKKTETGVSIHPLVRQRWRMLDVQAEIKGDNLSITYTGDNGQESLTINQNELPDEPIINSLTQTDRILLNLYAEQTKQVHQAGGPSLINGRQKEKEQQYAAGKKAYAEIVNHRGRACPAFNLDYL